MRQEEVSRWPAKGQYWAMLKPLGLLRMGELRPEDSGCAVRWTPDLDEEEMAFVFPLGPNDYRFLWNEWKTTYHSMLAFVPGDVWIYTMQTGEQRLFFVGPETTREKVQILSDHPLNFVLPQDPPKPIATSPMAVLNNTIGSCISIGSYTPEMSLFQPGAGRKKTPAKNAWEHIGLDE